MRFRQRLVEADGRVDDGKLYRLLRKSLSDSEIEALISNAPKRSDGGLGFEQLMDFIFDARVGPSKRHLAPAVGPGASAVRALRQAASPEDATAAQEDASGDGTCGEPLGLPEDAMPQPTDPPARGKPAPLLDGCVHDVHAATPIGDAGPVSADLERPPAAHAGQPMLSPGPACAAAVASPMTDPCAEIMGRSTSSGTLLQNTIMEEALVRQDSFRAACTIEKPGELQATWAIPKPLDKSVLQHFLELEQHGKVQAEYVWIDSAYTTDGHSFDMCSKSMTLQTSVGSASELPMWSYSGEDGEEVVIVPRRIYRDPFRPGNNILVLTDTFKSPEIGSNEEHGPPQPWNTRVACDRFMQRAINEEEEPWFGLEQEYYILEAETNWPLGWPRDGYPGPQGAYFCAIGATKAPGREVVEAHYRACLYAGVRIAGVNSEVAPGQWEFQVGPSPGVAAADDLWMARYLLQRVCEVFTVGVTFMPKPVPNWAGLGGHTNFSTAGTRGPGGWDVIQKHCRRLRSRHLEHMAVYGACNEKRLTGADDTKAFDAFSHNVGDRSASIRIPVKTASRRCGYYEDRRPAANMDPYLVMGMIVDTTLFRDDDMNPITAKPIAQPTSGTGDAAAGATL